MPVPGLEVVNRWQSIVLASITAAVRAFQLTWRRVFSAGLAVRTASCLAKDQNWIRLRARH